jgi:peptide chain release factor 1
MQKLEGIVVRHAELEKKLADPAALGQEYAKISKEHSDMTPIVELINAYKKNTRDIAEITEMLAAGGLDKDMKDMMDQEKFDLEHKIPDLEEEIKLSLIPKDAADEKNAILEVRAGTGGEEAALFAQRLFAMYQKYAEKNRWKFEILSIFQIELTGQQ